MSKPVAKSKIFSAIFFLTTSFFGNPVFAINGGLPIPISWYQLGAPLVGLETDITCAAVVLSPTRLLTAGHCVENSGTKWVTVRVFDPDSDRSEMIRAKISLNKNYQMGFRNYPSIDGSKNDLAVVVLGQPLSIKKDTAILPAENFRQSKFIFASSGLNMSKSTTGNSFEWFHLFMQTITISGESSSGLLSQGINVNVGICKVDSGGGYFLIENGAWILAAIQSVSSNAKPCNGKNDVNYAAPVRQHYDWIKSFL